MTPTPIQAAKQIPGLFRFQFLQLIPELEQFGGSEENAVESLNHVMGELGVLLQEEDVGERSIDVLAVHEDAELANDEGAAILEDLPVGGEERQKIEHEFVEVGIHARVGRPGHAPEGRAGRGSVAGAAKSTE